MAGNDFCSGLQQRYIGALLLQALEACLQIYLPKGEGELAVCRMLPISVRSRSMYWQLTLNRSRCASFKASSTGSRFATGLFIPVPPIRYVRIRYIERGR
jgi:hypothetical protein